MSSATTKMSLITAKTTSATRNASMARNYIRRICSNKSGRANETLPKKLISSTTSSPSSTSIKGLASSSSNAAASFSTTTIHKSNNRNAAFSNYASPPPPPPKPAHINPFYQKDQSEEKMQSMLEQTIFASSSQEQKGAEKLQQLRNAALKLSRYYSKHPRGCYLTLHPSSSLAIHEDNNDGDKGDTEVKSRGDEVIRMSGANICDRLLHLLFLPTTSEEITIEPLPEEELDALLEMCLLTITAYAKETIAGATFSANSKNNPMGNARRAEDILHKLLAIPIQYTNVINTDDSDNNMGMINESEINQKEELSEEEKKQKRQKTLLYILNSTLDTYSKAADSSLGGGSRLSRDAALKAEHLLLEAVQRADENENENKLLGESEEGFGEAGTKDSSVSTLFMVPPDVVSFNTVITAWAKSGRASSPSKMGRGRKTKRGGIRAGGNKMSDYEDEADTEETATAAAERAEAMLKLMQEMSDNNDNNSSSSTDVHPTRYTYDAVIRAWGRSPRPDASQRAVGVLTDMIERYNKYMSSSATTTKHDGDLMGPPPFPNLKTFTRVIQSLANSRSSDAPDKAESILENMEEYARRSSPRFGSTNGTNSYDYIQGDGDFVEDDNAARPSVINYNAVLSVFMKARCRSPEERYQMCIRMDELIAKMERLSEAGGEGLRVRPDRITRGTAISAWAQCAAFFRKRRTEDIMKKKKGKYYHGGGEEDRKWAESCAERARDHLLAAVEEWRRRGGGKNHNRILPNIHTFNDVIHSYGCAAQPELAREVFELASSLQPTIRPDFISYKSLIDAYADCARIDVNAARQAEAYLTEMERKFTEEGAAYAKPDREVYNSVLAGWAHSSDPAKSDRAYDLLMRLLDDYEEDLGLGRVEAVRPNTTSFAHVMSTMSDTKKMEDLLTKMEEMHEVRRTSTSPRDNNSVAHVTPNVVLYNMLLRTYSKQAKYNIDIALKAEKLLNRMNELYQTGVNSEVAPNRFSYAAVLSAYGQSRMKDAGKKALQILHMIQNDDGSSSGGGGGGGRQNHRKSEPLADTVVYNAVFSAMARGGDWKSAQRAEDLLREMEYNADAIYDGSNENVDISLPRPNSSSYTSVISAWSNTGSLKGAQRAEALLDRLVRRYERAQEEAESAATSIANTFDEEEKSGARRRQRLCHLDAKELRPDSMCYITVMRAYAKSKTLEGMQMAEKIMQRMEEASHSGNERLRPGTKAFNTIIFGWANCRHNGGTAKGFSTAQRAEDILNHMIQLHEGGYSPAAPDSKSFSGVIQAWKWSDEPGAARRAEDALLRKDAFRSVDKSIFVDVSDLNAVLMKYGEESDEETIGDAAEASEALLERMVAHYRETGNKRTAPNKISYNTVLHNYAKSKKEGHAQKAEDMLNRMEASANDGDDIAVPDPVSYRTCMNAWATSKEVGSVEKAEALFHRYLEICDPLDYSNGYNLLLKACATSPTSDESDPFGVAVRTFHRMRDNNDANVPLITHASYSYMFLICDKHLPHDQRQRLELFKRLFRECCEDGLVSAFVIDAMRQSVPDDFTAELFGLAGKQKIDDIKMEDIPDDWKRNVSESHHLA